MKPPTTSQEALAVAPLMKEAVPPVYTRDKGSPLEFEVPKKGKTDLRIQLESPRR